MKIPKGAYMKISAIVIKMLLHLTTKTFPGKKRIQQSYEEKRKTNEGDQKRMKMKSFPNWCLKNPSKAFQIEFK